MLFYLATSQLLDELAQSILFPLALVLVLPNVFSSQVNIAAVAFRKLRIQVVNDIGKLVAICNQIRLERFRI